MTTPLWAFLQPKDAGKERERERGRERGRENGSSVLSAVITLQLYGQNMALQGTLLSRQPGFDQVVAECVSH